MRDRQLRGPRRGWAALGLVLSAACSDPDIEYASGDAATGGSAGSSTGGTGAGGAGGAAAGAGSGGSAAVGGGGSAGAAGASPYVEAVLSDKPVGYWRFEETAGPQLDNQTGPELGTATSITLDVQGAFGASRGIGLLDASQVSFGNHFGYEGVAAFTVELWLRPTTYDTRALILSKFKPTGGWRGRDPARFPPATPPSA